MKNNKILILGLLLTLGAPFTSFASIDKNLKYGQRDTEVAELQEFLINKGLLKTSPSNYFGQLTFKAVKAYQLSINVSSTGFVGALTREKINNEIGSGVASVSTENKNQVKITDDKLKNLVSEAENLVKALEEDKENFKLLRKTVDEHKQKAREHASNMLNIWIVHMDTSLPNIPIQYHSYVRNTRSIITSDIEPLNEMITKFYSLTDVYFLDPLTKKDNIEVAILKQQELNNCIKIWTLKASDPTCNVFTLGFASDIKRNNERAIKEILSGLSSSDTYVLDTINDHAKITENGVKKSLDAIYDLSNAEAFAELKLSQVQQQAERSYSQPVFNQTVQCYTTTNSLIFDKTRTYNTRCEAVTITPAQRCASNKAKQLSGGGLIISSQPDPTCN